MSAVFYVCLTVRYIPSCCDEGTMAHSRFWGFASYLWWVRWPCVSKKSPRLGFPHTHLEPDLCALLSCGFEDRNFLESLFHHLWNGIITSTFNNKTYTHTHSLTSASICESTDWTRNCATKEGYYISVLRHTTLGLRRLQHFLNRRIVVSGNAVDSEMARAGVPITGQARAIPEWFRPKNWRETFRRPAQCWLCLMCEFSQSTSSLWALVFLPTKWGWWTVHVLPTSWSCWEGQMRWLMFSRWGQGSMQHVLWHFSVSPAVRKILEGSDCVFSRLVTMPITSHSADAQKLVIDK